MHCDVAHCNRGLPRSRRGPRHATPTIACNKRKVVPASGLSAEQPGKRAEHALWGVDGVNKSYFLLEQRAPHHEQEEAEATPGSCASPGPGPTACTARRGAGSDEGAFVCNGTAHEHGQLVVLACALALPTP